MNLLYLSFSLFFFLGNLSQSREINTTFYVREVDRKGTTKIYFDQNGKLDVQFYEMGNGNQMLLEQITDECKTLIVLGFFQQTTLTQTLHQLGFQKQNSTSNNYRKQSNSQMTEVLLNQKHNTCKGASTYNGNKLNQKITYKYLNQQLSECLIRTKLYPEDHLIKLKFDTHE